MKRFSALLIALLYLTASSGCGKDLPPQPHAPSLQPERSASPTFQAPPIGERQNPCGNGICEATEQANPNLCPADCDGTATTSPTQLSVGTDTPSFVPTDIALPNDLIFIPDSGIRIRFATQPAPVIGADGAIYIFYSNKNVLPNDPSSNLVARSEDGLTFDEVGLEPHTVDAVNPFAVHLPDGTWRLYDMDSQTGVMTSRSSTDEILFTPDDGVRYTAPPEHLPIGVRHFYVNTSGDVIFLYIAAMAKDNHYIRSAVSTDGGESFAFHTDDVLGDQNKADLERNVDPKFVVLPDGSARIVTMVQYQVPIPGQRACCKFYSFTSADGYTYTQDAGIRLQTSDFTEFTVWSLNDPWMIMLPDGRFRLYMAALVDDGSGDEPFWAIVSATNP